MPFVNSLEAGVHDEAGLLYISNFTVHVAKGFKKGTKCIAKLLISYIKSLI